MDEFDLLTAVAEAVQQFIKCPVCLDTVKIPFKQCMKGHIVCSECIKSKSHQACSICKTSFLYDNPTEELELLKALPKLCRNSKYGCKEVDRDEYHKFYCEYKPANCRQLDCKQILPLNKLVKHYKLKHKDHIVIGTYGKELSGVFDTNMLNDDHTLVCTFHKDFPKVRSYSWLIFRRHKARKTIKVILLQMLEEEPESSVCFAILKIGEEDNYPCYKYTHTFPHMTTKAFEDYNENGKNTDPNEDFYLRLPLAAVKEMAEQDGKLKYKITLYELSNK